MSASSTGRNIDHAAALLAQLHDTLKPEFGFELWDGRTIPADLGDGLRIAVTHESVLTRLLRHPRATTLIDLYAAGHIEIRGGSLFDIAGRRPKVRTKDALRALDKMRVLRHVLPLALARDTIEPLSMGSAKTADGSNAEDIAFHYDVSNDFYRLFLDPEMVYTCGYFRDWGNDLATAQRDKLEMICRKLRLKPGDRLLDIGCGWGALICHAVEHYGVEAVGVTLSPEQLALARERIAARGLEGRARVELKDFRALEGTFDKIASIGMFEHVGIDNHAGYFDTVHRLLSERGLYLHHAITRRAKADDRAFRRKRPEYKAMTRYIFPGGEVDHIGMTVKNLEVHGFEVHDVEGWREHYARTTELWARALMANREAAVGFAGGGEVGAAKVRIWILYLTGVSLAFRQGTLSIFQTLASRRSRGPSGLPPTREDLYR